MSDTIGLNATDAAAKVTLILPLLLEPSTLQYHD